MNASIEGQQASNPWIACPCPQSRARARLFCLPYVGGGTVVYHKWPELLSPEIEVCAVRLPGREGRVNEPPFRRVIPLVHELAHVLEPLLDKPYALFGHSMGAVTAFELARQLRRQGRSAPIHLFVSGCYPPCLLHPRTNRTSALTDNEFIERLKEYNGVPEEILQEPDLMQFFLPMLRADFEMFETYGYADGQPLDCPITSFGGLSDPNIGHEHVLGWHKHTKGTFDSHMLPGDHFFLQTGREHLLQMISRDLMRDLGALNP